MGFILKMKGRCIVMSVKLAGKDSKTVRTKWRKKDTIVIVSLLAIVSVISITCIAVWSNTIKNNAVKSIVAMTDNDMKNTFPDKTYTIYTLDDVDKLDVEEEGKCLGWNESTQEYDVVTNVNKSHYDCVALFDDTVINNVEYDGENPTSDSSKYEISEDFYDRLRADTASYSRHAHDEEIEWLESHGVSIDSQFSESYIRDLIAKSGENIDVDSMIAYCERHGIISESLGGD